MMKPNLHAAIHSAIQYYTAKSLRTIFQKYMLVAFFMVISIGVWGQTPVPMSSQAGLTYTENFTDITNWANNFASGIGANRWASYPVTTGGSANDGKRTTKSSATFATGTSGGAQKGTGNLVFLSTGNGATSEAVAVDFLLDFTGVSAGTLSFDWAAIDNTSGTRPTSLRVFSSTDNITFTEITAAQVIDVQSPSSGSITTVALPAAFNNSSTARLRFYNHAGIVTGSGNRDKIAIDNLTVTATGASSTPSITLSPTTTLSLGTTICEGSSGSGSYSVSGKNLTEDLVLKPSANVEISIDNLTWYSSTSPTDLSLAFGSGTVAATTIQVRSITSLTPGAFTGSITHTSSAATTATKDISGTVISPQTPTVSIGITTGSNPMCGSTATTFTATPTNAGGGTVSYQWKLNGSNAGTNTATFTVATPANNDQISCVITITGGCVTATTTSSSTITLNVNAVPLTPSTPTSNSPQCLPTGVTVSRSGSAPIGETWYWQTSSTGTAEAAVNSAATYTVTSAGTTTIYLRSKSTAGCWSAASSVTVTVNPQTAISTQPANQSVGAGNTATFSVVAVGVGLAYQWQVDKGSGFSNITVSDGTAATNSFTTVAATLAMNGYKYKVIITGTCGNVTSDGNATLTVTAISYAQGDFLSITGTGSYTVASSWGRCNQIGGCTGTTLGAGGWGAAGANGVPIATTTVFIQGSITISGALGVANSTILSGGNLIVTGAHPVSNSMTIKSGGKVTNSVGGNLNFNPSSATFNVEDYGIVEINEYTTNINTSLWNGVEKFSENSSFYINYGRVGEPLFDLETRISTNPATGAKFGNLIFQPTLFGGAGSHWTGIFPNATYQLTKKDLTINNVSTGRNFTLNDGTANITIGGNHGSRDYIKRNKQTFFTNPTLPQNL